jgi:hypothetical protein
MAITVSGNAFSDGLSKGGIATKIYNILWGIRFAFKNGRPQKVFRFGGGLGDHLMVSAVFREYRKRGVKSLWMMSDHPAIFEGNQDVDRVVPDSWRVEKYCSRLGVMPRLLSYGRWINDTDRLEPPKKHILAEILERAGLSGEVALRPWFPAVLPNGNQVEGRCVCIQGSGTRSSTEMKNKQWDCQKYEELASHLADRYELVQLGMPGESDIPGAKDLRGMLSIQETAKVLAGARFFIGQVGFLMHLARAVETRSIVIFGGREKAWQSGYPCNENLETDPQCSPCWQSNKCDYDRVCLSDISVEDVLNAIERMEKRLSGPLETITHTLN